MKNLFYAFAFFALSSVADQDGPIVAFSPGEYLGLGNYMTNLGQEGDYASYAEITSNTWNIAHYHGDELRLYSASFNFHPYGFFEVVLTDNSDEENPKSFEGAGYCWSFQCHIAANFEDSLFEVTATFLPWEDSIYWLGSIHSLDKDNQFSISWEESMTRINPEEIVESLMVHI
jgi:hypothetical protein